MLEASRNIARLHLVRVPGETRTLEELLNGMADGFNRMVEVGRVDRVTTRVMMGYLSAGAIALRCNGLDDAADLFLEAARELEANWESFEDVCRKLARQFGRRS